MSRTQHHYHKAQPDFIDYMLSNNDPIPLLDRSLNESFLSDCLLRDQGIELEEDLLPTEDELYSYQVEHQEEFITSH